MLSMTKGEISYIFIESSYAFGKEGKGKIPPNTDIVMRVELIDIKRNVDIPEPINPRKSF